MELYGNKQKYCFIEIIILHSGGTAFGSLLPHRATLKGLSLHRN